MLDLPDHMLTGLFRLGEPRHVYPIMFQVESIKACRAEVQPLIEQHYEEIAQFKAVQKLDPDWDAYARLEEQGKLWVMTARSDGYLVGYIVMMVSRDLHYKNLLRATEDIHFLLPQFRKGLTGYRMLAKMKQAMKEMGVQTITLRTKANSDHGVLFERLGGVLHDLVYTIVVD